jgi:YtfJ family uncharacterized protein
LIPRAALPCLLAVLPCLAGVSLGQKLPDVTIADKGAMVPQYRIEGGRMVLASKDLAYRPFRLSDTQGHVRTIYHLATRLGIDKVNKPYIDAILAAHLPEFLPDSPYKTVTILNLDDAMFGTRGLGLSRLEDSQRESPHAIFVPDVHGAAQAAWGLQKGQSAVIVLDRDGTVLFFKEGKLSPEEIQQAIGIIREKTR